MEDILIKGPVMLFLPPNDLAVVLDSLAERPYKVAEPVMSRIMNQIKAHNEARKKAEEKKDAGDTGTETASVQPANGEATPANV